MQVSCEDFSRRFDGFIDGQLDGQSIRAMALHASQCAACGAELERGERLQVWIGQAVEAEVETLDTSHLWSAIQARLEPPRTPIWAGIRAGLAFDRWLSPAPALASLGMIGLVVTFAAALLFALLPLSTPNEPLRVADNQARIERIESNASHVAVWSEPSQNTTAIWVASYEPEGAP